MQALWHALKCVRFACCPGSRNIAIAGAAARPVIQTGAAWRIASCGRDLDADIAQAEARLAELDRLRSDAAARLKQLHRLRAPGGAGPQPNNGGEPSPASKVSLFRDLFRGREDVFAIRWENRARGRAGYAPRCANEWQPGICGKPKVRCGACTNSAFVALGDRELLAHLQGRGSWGFIRCYRTTHAGCW